MKAPDETEDQVVEAEKSLPALVEEMEGDADDIFEKLRFFSSLSQFQIKVFKGEPKLVNFINQYNS